MSAIQLRTNDHAAAVVPQGVNSPEAELQRMFADPSIPDQAKFEITVQGLIYERMARRELQMRLQGALHYVAHLEGVAAQEIALREGFLGTIDGLRNENAAFKQQVQVLSDQSERDQATMAADKVAVDKLVKRAEAQEKINAAQKARIDKDEEKAKEKARKDFDDARDRILDYEISAAVLTGSVFLSPIGIFLFTKYHNSQKEAASLYAQYHLFDELKPITNEAERSLRINALANGWLRKQGYLARITGTTTFPNGRVYEGEFVDHDTLTEGVLTGPGGFWYKGSFYNGLPHGKGEEKSRQLGTYVGEYQHGKRHGNGLAKFPNGTTYDGEHRAGNFHGQGVYTYANGDVHKGEFANGKQHGEGVYTLANGDVSFRGEFVNGKRQAKNKDISMSELLETLGL